MSRYSVLIIVALVFAAGIYFWPTGAVAQSTAIIAGLITLLGISDLIQWAIIAHIRCPQNGA